MDSTWECVAVAACERHSHGEEGCRGWSAVSVSPSRGARREIPATQRESWTRFQSSKRNWCGSGKQFDDRSHLRRNGHLTGKELSDRDAARLPDRGELQEIGCRHKSLASQ